MKLEARSSRKQASEVASLLKVSEQWATELTQKFEAYIFKGIQIAKAICISDHHKNKFLDVYLSGDDALNGYTRSHTEHEG